MKQIQKAKDNTEWNVFIDGNQVTIENRGFKKNVNLGGSHRYLEERNDEAIKLVTDMYYARKRKKKKAWRDRALRGEFHLDNDYKLVSVESVGLPLDVKFIYQSKTCPEHLIIVSHDDTIYNLNADAFEEVE